VILKAAKTWPRTAKVYCHRAVEWPVDAAVVERVPVRSCERRGASIDLVLDRGRENRSQFVLTRIRGGREAIFWQTARTAKQARPNVGLPKARAAGLPALEIVVDSHERYAYTFSHQQATTTRAALPAGDYGVIQDGRLVASVERKSLADLVATLTSGRLKYVLAELSALGRPLGQLVATLQLDGTPIDIKVEMDSQSILHRTLWLFGGAFLAAIGVLALLIWLAIRKGADPAPPAASA